MTNRFASSMSNSSYSSKKRSLLGYDDPDAEAMVKQTQEQIAAQNEAKVRRGAFLNLFLFSASPRRLGSSWKARVC